MAYIRVSLIGVYYKPNFVRIEKFFCGRTDRRTPPSRKKRKNCENHRDNLIIFSTRPYMQLQQPVLATCLPVKSTAKACGHIRSPLMRDSRAGLTTDER